MKFLKFKSKEQKQIERERVKHHNEIIKQEKESRKEYKEAPNDSFLILKDINKIYDNHVQAVYDFNLSVNQNEFIVLVGPSGCGKSTTLRMIAGLEDITSGDLFIDGEYSNYISPKDRDIAMVFQSYALYPHMTVYDNMAFGLKIKRIPKDEIDRRVKEAAEILQLEDFLDRKPRALSGGQCQRVALGRALVRNAKLFLMDEPLSNLDAKLRVQMRSKIVELHQRVKATTIYVTHDQTEAMTMADRIVVMKDGYVQQIGRPIDIYNHPANTFVASFIGSPAMNIFEGTLKNDILSLSDTLKVKLDKKALDELKSNLNKDIETSNIEDTNYHYKDYFIDKEIKVLIGIRPEDIVKASEIKNIEHSSDIFSIVVRAVELLGHEYFIHFDFNNTELISKIQLSKKLITQGEQLDVALNIDNLHIFSMQTLNTLL